jgi:2-polyprenyl-3-methyl-5-hydroxy-6-metoxy-1,4-benzoquinol methylase
MQCPVCSNEKSSPLLELNKFPIFQHPVEIGSVISPPFDVDLVYVSCTDCGHAYQESFDRSILENLYKHHYYTPRPDNLATQFRDEFMSFFSSQLENTGVIFDDEKKILEVGCSSAEVIVDIHKKFKNFNLVGVEPNQETREKAQSKGYEVHNSFFDKKFSQQLDQKFDIIYSRHVIEHVFDFDDFMLATNDLCNDDGLLFIETPCLDWAVLNSSLAPFHVEHITLFGKRSLQRLLKRYGWSVIGFHTTTVGNMIMACSKTLPAIDEYSIYSNIEALQKDIVDKQLALKEVINDRKIIMWGAGSGGRGLMSFLDFLPDVILDGNPNKLNRYFVGYENCPILLSTKWIADNMESQSEWLIIVASSYYNEIQQELKLVGWEGDVISPYQVS